MLLNTLKTIYRHPFNRENKLGSLARFVKWQVSSRLHPHPVLYRLTGRTQLIMWRGLTGATGNLYCGLLEFEDMGFLLHFLRPTDLFVDVGANVGVYTLLAAGEVGAQSIAVEPIPQTFAHLQQNIATNHLHTRVTAHNVGLGATNGSIQFTRSLDTVNHVATADETDTIDVPVTRLDDLLGEVPALIKIDVEGFETEVLKGATRLLAAPTLRAIIIELNGSGARYGYDEDRIHQQLLDEGFAPHTYDPKTRALIALPSYGRHNTIYLRDTAFVQDRVRTARQVEIGPQGRRI